jgi:4-hydroxybutyryl-CoA dehydratase/vinylacetyl-CoA-Delta-isomerase
VVRAFEVWNEPNHPAFLTGTDPAEYAKVLQAAYRGIKDGNPKADVVFGGTAYIDVDWIRAALDAGAQGNFDVMGVHPYPSVADEPPTTPDDGTKYHANFTEFLKHMQKNDLAANAGVTDVKGDRSLSPSEQVDKDMFLRVVEKTDKGIVVRGAKAHQTGSLSAHEIIVLPTRAMGKADKDYSVAFAIPSDTKGLIHVVGRSTLDKRELEGCDIGNVYYSKYCPTLIFDNVFVPWERVFMCGETEFAVEMVIRFSSFHRQSHGGCKSGRMDCMIGAALTLMDYNGTTKMSHLRQKIIDMIHRAETLYGCCLASSYEGYKEPSGTYFIDTVLANASKIHEGKELAEAIRLMVDACGGFVADLPSDKDFENPEIGALLKKYLKGVDGIPVENRVKMYRLVENLAMESADSISDIHGGGSPEAHRVTIFRETNLEGKKKAAKRLAGIDK